MDVQRVPRCLEFSFILIIEHQIHDDPLVLDVFLAMPDTPLSLGESAGVSLLAVAAQSRQPVVGALDAAGCLNLNGLMALRVEGL
jgi:hypothetical protein